MNAHDEEFGEERLKHDLRDVMHMPVDEIAARISRAVTDWMDGGFRSTTMSLHRDEGELMAETSIVG
jgi:hypothetical protein